MEEVFPKSRSFPQIIFDGVKIGGYTELEAKIKYELK